VVSVYWTFDVKFKGGKFNLLNNYRPAMPFGNTKKNSIENIFSPALTHLKKPHPHGNPKFNY